MRRYVGRTPPIALCILAVLIDGRVAHGQSRDLQALRAEMIGTLLDTDLTVQIDGAPLKNVINALSKALDVNIIARYATTQITHGMDPAIPIYLEMDTTPALTVLESVLEQAALYEPCTWQLRDGFVEVGTKERLSTPAATEHRTYDIRDLLIEPPYFQGPSLGAFLAGGLTMPSAGGSYSRVLFDQHPYKSAALTEGLPSRKTPEELAQEILMCIVQTIEPGNWDYGQYSDEPEFEESAQDDPESSVGRGKKHRMTRKIASIRLHKSLLVIDAPDYIHRQINGYSRVVRPAALDDDLRALRSAAASIDRCTITVVDVRPTTPVGDTP